MKDFKLRLKNMSKKKEHKNNTKIYTYDDSFQQLLSEIKKFKSTHFPKESNKIIKMTYFTRYLKYSKNTISNSKIDLIWSNNYFEDGFIEELEKFDVIDELLPKIMEILCGNFSSSKKIKKMRKYLPEQNLNSELYLKRKQCSFYSTKLYKTNKKILFCICLQKSCDEFAEAGIYFVTITDEPNIELKGSEYIKNNILNDEKFPSIEFDKCAFYINKEILFSKEVKDSLSNNIIVSYPVKKIPLEKIIIFKRELINKKIKD